MDKLYTFAAMKQHCHFSVNRNLLIIISGILFLSCSCSLNRSIISGRIENYDKTYFVLKKILPEEVVLVDTVLILNGSFSYRIKSKQTGIYLLEFSDTLFVSFIAAPGDNLILSADANNIRQTYDIQGNEETKLLLENQRRLESLYQQTKFLSDKFIRSTYKNNFDSVKIVLDSIYVVNFNAHKDYLTDFILSHPNKLASLMAFYQLLGNNAFFSLKEDRVLLDSIYPVLSATYPDNVYIDDLKEKLMKYE
ncbi:MAG: DUF4369 domain-containing protein [Bacteroidales bacterium]|jgi:hypothetical protein|nr:DUF4369 domain-containing protein [Bacteroidales bacterium]